MTAHKTWKPEARCSACRPLNRLENVLSKCFICSETIPGSSSGSCFFEVVALVSNSSLKPGLSENDSQPSLVFTVGREELSESGQFQVLPQATLNCLLSS